MNSPTIRVYQNPEVDFPSFMCEHAFPYFNVKEGDLRVCMECGDLLDKGAIVVDEETGKVCWPMEAVPPEIPAVNAGTVEKESK